MNRKCPGYVALVVACVMLGALRLALPSNGINPSDVFKDLAHLFVGGLFGAAINAKTDWRLWIAAVGMVALEIVAFVTKQ